MVRDQFLTISSDEKIGNCGSRRSISTANPMITANIPQPKRRCFPKTDCRSCHQPIMRVSTSRMVGSYAETQIARPHATALTTLHDGVMLVCNVHSLQIATVMSSIRRD